MPRKSRRRSRRGGDPKLEAHIKAIKENVGKCYLPKNMAEEYDGSKRDCDILKTALESANRDGYGGDGMYKTDKKIDGKNVTRMEWFSRHCVPHGKDCKKVMTDSRHGSNAEINKLLHQAEAQSIKKFPTMKKAAHGNHGHSSGETGQAGTTDNISNADRALTLNRGGKRRRRKSRKKSSKGGRKSRKKRRKSRKSRKSRKKRKSRRRRRRRR